MTTMIWMCELKKEQDEDYVTRVDKEAPNIFIEVTVSFSPRLINQCMPSDGNNFSI